MVPLSLFACKKNFYKYEGNHVYLDNAEYRNNTLAVVMYTASGEPYSNVTVNLNHPLQFDRMAFLDENNMPGIGKWIEKNRLGTFTGVKACSGFCINHLYQLDLK